MKATCLFCVLSVLALFSCTGRSSFLDTEGLELFDLQSGGALTARDARHADGIYGSLQTILFDSPQSLSFVRFREGRYTLDILCGEGADADSTSAFCSRTGAMAGINGSYFNMSRLTPVTYIKDDGVERGITAGDERFRTNGSVLLDAGQTRIDADTTCGGSPFWEVMASGPILVDEGCVVSYSEDTPGWEGFYDTRHPRSLVGQDAEGYVWLVVVDGRFEGRAVGMTIAELTELSRLLGLTDALNLDGGGSSTLWARPAGVLNHPSDNHRFDHAGERVVPNILAVFPAR